MLGACFPLPIKYESRRRNIQRSLTLFSLSLPLFWLPIIMMITGHEMSSKMKVFCISLFENVNIHFKDI